MAESWRKRNDKNITSFILEISNNKKKLHIFGSNDLDIVVLISSF